MIRLALVLFVLFTTAVQAQVVTECIDDWRVSAWNLAEPWEDNTRTFSNGKTRVAIVDTTEPAAASFHILILSPPYDELGTRQCRLLSFGHGMGYGAVTLEGMATDYDPSVGLMFGFPVRRPVMDGSEPWQGLFVTLNQATGEISASLQ